MRRKILWAEARCYLYLLFCGMWKGECQFRGHNYTHELTLIAVGTGNIGKGNVNITRIFFNPTAKSKEFMTASLNGWDWVRRA